MPGPYPNALTYGLNLLNHLGGYNNTSIPPDPEFYNKLTGAVVDLASQFQGTYFEPSHFGAVGDGVADDFIAITKCFAAAKAAGVAVFFRKGTYRISKALVLDGFSDLYIYGNSNAKIVFPSADTTLIGADPYKLPNNERSAFFLQNCANVTIERINFEGNQAPEITTNGGLAVNCGAAVTGLRLMNCRQTYGGGLVTQLEDAATTDAVVFSCRSYGSRGNSRLGHGGVFLSCTFELPVLAEYNRVGDKGSSHAIYQYASAGDDISVKNCRFVNIRKSCVKVSGSASPSYGYSVEDCTFINCGRNHDGTLTETDSCISAGADDNVVHAQFSIQNNRARNCGAFATILGSKSVQIVGNQIHHTTSLPSSLAAMVDISRYITKSEPIEDVVCMGNHFSSEVSSGTMFVTNAIRLTGVGLGLSGRSSLAGVRSNHIGNGYAQGISAVDCLNPVIEENALIGLGSAMQLVGSRMPRIIRNDIIDQRSNNAQIRMANVSWPIISGNFGSNRLIANSNGKPATGDNAGGQVPVAFPLCGFFGRAQATGLRPEVVFAYGSGWTDGDIVDWNQSNTFTYKTAAPGANQFNSLGGLIALLNALPGFGAEDYGKPWNIATGHIRIRKDTPSASSNSWVMRTVCANPTAGVILRNTALLNGQWSSLRGEGASGDRVVIWSPCLGMGEVPRLLPENAAAATVLGTIPYPVVTSAAEEAFADAVLALPAPPQESAKTALYYWVVS